MFTSRTLMLVGLALLIALATALAINGWLSRAVTRAQAEARRSSAAAQPRVLVATRLLPQGAVLEADDVDWRAWPASAEGYLTAVDADPGKLAGAVLRTAVAAGQPIPADAVVRLGAVGGVLAAALPPDRRAVTVGVTAISGLAGFLMPGDRVDVVLSRVRIEPGGQRAISQTLLQNIRVLAVDQRAENPDRKIEAPRSVTLEVTPEQAQTLALVADLGRLTLSLRSLGAPPEPLRIPPADARSLGLAEASPDRRPRSQAPPPARVVVVRGVQPEGRGGAAAFAAVPGAGR